MGNYAIEIQEESRETLYEGDSAAAKSRCKESGEWTGYDRGIGGGGVCGELREM